MRRILAVCCLLAATSCVGGGYDLQRYQNDSKHKELFSKVVEKWVDGIAPNDLELRTVPDALNAWEERLKADAKLLGVTR